jgi:hypothetical protein
MTTSSQSESAPTIVLPLPEPGGGHVHIVVPVWVYERYQALRQREILSKEQLIRLATHNGAESLTVENVTAAILLPGRIIRERVADLDRAARAIAAGSTA